MSVPIGNYYPAAVAWGCHAEARCHIYASDPSYVRLFLRAARYEGCEKATGNSKGEWQMVSACERQLRIIDANVRES